MQHAGYFIGQEVPLERTQEAIQAGGSVRWYCFQTTPQKEASAQAWFRLRRLEAWFPTITKHRRIPRGRVKTKPYEARVVPRYIFVRFDGEPRWHVVRRCPYITRVVGVEDRPLPISDDVMMDVKGCKAYLQRQRDEQAELDQAEIEKLAARFMVAEGERAEVVSGPFAGYIADVRSVRGQVVRFVIPALSEMEIQTQLGTTLARLDGDS